MEACHKQDKGNRNRWAVAGMYEHSFKEKENNYLNFHDHWFKKVESNLYYTRRDFVGRNSYNSSFLCGQCAGCPHQSFLQCLVQT